MDSLGPSDFYPNLGEDRHFSRASFLIRNYGYCGFTLMEEYGDKQNDILHLLSSLGFDDESTHAVMRRVVTVHIAQLLENGGGIVPPNTIIHKGKKNTHIATQDLNLHHENLTSSDEPKSSDFVQLDDFLNVLCMTILKETKDSNKTNVDRRNDASNRAGRIDNVHRSAKP